jgi:hypothetical protein
MTIPAEHRELLVSTGIAFLRSITEAYGTDTGMELWEKINSTLDPDVKGSIFFAMLTGDHQGGILVPMQNVSEKITAIKAVREAAGKDNMGLKEAKDFVESLPYGSLTLKVPVQDRLYAIRRLREGGIVLR